MQYQIENYTEEIFDKIEHIDDNGNEYWFARELQIVLEYKEWRKFSMVIEKAKISCKQSKYNINDNFVLVDKIVKTGVATKKIDDYKLSRYACYLIAQNGDSRKMVIALAQTYFAIQTRKQEIFQEELKSKSEDEKRIKIREQVKKGNYGLNKTAVKSGVKNLAEFHNAGYKGLYNGETANDIAKRKKLKYREDILDFMGSEELADNLFRIIQTDARLNREKTDNKFEANYIHYEIGKKVRKSIKEMKGTMPEKLPKPKSSIKKIDK